MKILIYKSFKHKKAPNSRDEPVLYLLKTDSFTKNCVFFIALVKKITQHPLTLCELPLQTFY